MEESIYSSLSKNIVNIDNYEREIKETEKFFYSKNIKKSKLDEIFWNHLLSLFERIDSNLQNDLESYKIEGITKESEILLEEYIKYISKIRNFSINNFERMLLNIYTQRMLEEE